MIVVTVSEFQGSSKWINLDHHASMSARVDKINVCALGASLLSMQGSPLRRACNHVDERTAVLLYQRVSARS